MRIVILILGQWSIFWVRRSTPPHLIPSPSSPPINSTTKSLPFVAPAISIIMQSNTLRWWLRMIWGVGEGVIIWPIWANSPLVITPHYSTTPHSKPPPSSPPITTTIHYPQSMTRMIQMMFWGWEVGVVWHNLIPLRPLFYTPTGYSTIPHPRLVQQHLWLGWGIVGMGLGLGAMGVITLLVGMGPPWVKTHQSPSP